MFHVILFSFYFPLPFSLLLPLFDLRLPYNPAFYSLRVLCPRRHLLVPISSGMLRYCVGAMTESTVPQLLSSSLSFFFLSVGLALSRRP